MAADFIPQANDTFFRWQNVFFNYVSENLDRFNLTLEALKEFIAAKERYEQAFQRASNPESANRADRLERDISKAEYRTAIRRFINSNLRYNPLVSDYDRQTLGLVIPDRTPTASAVPGTHPVLSVDFSELLHHTIHIKDDKLDSKRKPAGVKECEIWYKISDELPKINELQYAGSSSKPTFFMEFGSDNEGKKIWYCARWINTRGQHGRWGAFASAIIA